MSELFHTFGVDWKILLTQMINFGILLYLLKRYAYGPILGMLQERKSIIEKGLSDASKAEKNLLEAKANAEELTREAKSGANAIVLEAQNQANQFSAKVKYDALTEKGKIIESAQGEIEAIRVKNERSVKEKAVDHIVSGVRSILGEEMTSEMNNRIIKKLTHTS